MLIYKQLLTIARYKRIWNAHLNGVGNNHSFASYHILLYPPRCSGFQGFPHLNFCFWTTGGPWLDPPVYGPVSCPALGEASGGMVSYNHCPPPCGRGTERKLDRCLRGGWMQTEHEWAGWVEEEALGAGVRPVVSAGPPLSWGCRSLAKKRSAAGLPRQNTFLRHLHYYQHLKSNYWFWNTKTFAK